MLLASAVQESKRIHPSQVREPECRVISGGEFIMGSQQGPDNERPAHGVWVDAFEIAICQVRNRDFAAFLEATNHPTPPQWNLPEFDHPDQPVVAVSWFEAAKYCNWLSSLTGRDYRLPTEAEWERAARGGLPGMFYPWGDQPPEARPEYQRRWGGEVRGPLPVGQGEANPFGIYDLCENVHEWCSDWFQDNYYAVSPPRNPRGPEGGDRRSSRGGSWRHHVKASRCVARSSIPPQFQYADYGFRVVREVS